MDMHLWMERRVEEMMDLTIPVLICMGLIVVGALDIFRGFDKNETTDVFFGSFVLFSGIALFYTFICIA